MIDVDVARTIGEAESLRDDWSSLQGDAVTSDFDYVLTYIRESPKAHRPHVVRLAENGRPAGLVVGRIEDVTLSAKIGYRTVYSPEVRALTVAYGGFLGGAGADLAPAAIASLRSSLAQGEADVAILRNVRTDSPPYAEARSQPGLALRQHVVLPMVHRRRELPSSYDEFLASLSKRTREGIRRSARRLEKEQGERMALRWFNEPADVDGFFEDAERVAATTYQRGLGVAVRGDALELALTRAAAERGWFRACILYLDDQPVAFWHGFAYRGIFRTSVPGYLPELRHLNVGIYVLMKLVETLCAEPEVTALDFGFGDAEYKRRFADQEWHEATLAIYAPSWRGARLNAAQTGFAASNRLARAVVSADLAARAKQEWRARIAKQQS